MRQRPLIGAVLALVVSVGAALFSGAPAAAGPKVSKSDLDYIRSAMAKYDIPAETQKTLLKAYVAGERWDSQSGATPVATETSHIDGFERTIYRYADGSINVGEIEIPSESVQDGISPMAISECQSYSKTGWNAWRNCKIRWDGVTWSVTFYADYGVVVGPPYPPNYQCSIDSIRGLTYAGAGMQSGSGKLEYITKSAYGYRSQCIAQGTATQCGPFWCEVLGVRLTVTAEHNGGWTSLVQA